MVVEADVEAGSRLRRDDVEGGVADVDAGQFEVRWLKGGGALVQRLADQPVGHADDRVDRVVGKMRVGDMALAPDDADRGGQAAAAADLYRIAKAGLRSRLADQRGVEMMAAVARPFDQLYGSVD